MVKKAFTRLIAEPLKDSLQGTNNQDLRPQQRSHRRKMHRYRHADGIHNPLKEDDESSLLLNTNLHGPK
jgi:hypothetical protein